MTHRNWPTAQTYADHVACLGISVTVDALEREQQAFTAIGFAAPSGATAIEIVRDMAEPLMSTTIARLDRRLGIKSHLFR